MRALLPKQARSLSSVNSSKASRAAAVRPIAVVAAPSPVSIASVNMDVKQRAKAAILGGLVADAATMPLHWIYDVPKIQELLASKSLEATPEFFPEPSCSFYKHPFGALSPYGHELIPLLASMADNGGELDAGKYSEAMHTYFTQTEPEAYRNKSVRSVVAAAEAGARGTDCGDKDDFQANCFAKASLLVARYAGKPELLPKVEAAVRVQQNNDAAVAYGTAGARILECVVLGSSVAEALAWAAGEGGLAADTAALVARGLDTLKQPLQELTYEPAPYMQDMVSRHVAIRDSLAPLTWAVWCNGPACGNPAAFANVAMLGAHAAAEGTVAGSYVAGVRSNLLAGGDNCSRACLLGALLAAEGGMDSIPADWRAKTARFAEYEALVDRLLAAP